jgi:hypothetical protein
MDTEGTAIYGGGSDLGLGIRPFVRDEESSFGWQITPFVGLHGLGTYDGATGGLLNQFGITSRLEFQLPHGILLIVANQFSHFNSLEFKIEDVEIDPGVEQDVLKNGLMVDFPLWSAKSLYANGFVVDTRFLQDAAVDNYQTFGAGLSLRGGCVSLNGYISRDFAKTTAPERRRRSRLLNVARPRPGRTRPRLPSHPGPGLILSLRAKYYHSRAGGGRHTQTEGYGGRQAGTCSLCSIYNPKSAMELTLIPDPCLPTADYRLPTTGNRRTCHPPHHVDTPSRAVMPLNGHTEKDRVPSPVPPATKITHFFGWEVEETIAGLMRDLARRDATGE